MALLLLYSSFVADVLKTVGRIITAAALTLLFLPGIANADVEVDKTRVKLTAAIEFLRSQGVPDRASMKEKLDFEASLAPLDALAKHLNSSKLDAKLDATLLPLIFDYHSLASTYSTYFGAQTNYVIDRPDLAAKLDVMLSKTVIFECILRIYERDYQRTPENQQQIDALLVSKEKARSAIQGLQIETEILAGTVRGIDTVVERGLREDIARYKLVVSRINDESFIVEGVAASPAPAPVETPTAAPTPPSATPSKPPQKQPPTTAQPPTMPEPAPTKTPEPAKPVATTTPQQPVEKKLASTPQKPPVDLTELQECNGFIVAEIESADPPPSCWAEDSSLEGFFGESYFSWICENQLLQPSDNGHIGFEMSIAQAGDYYLYLHNFPEKHPHPSPPLNPNRAGANTIWVRLTDAGGSSIVPGGCAENDVAEHGWFTLYSTGNEWNWSIETSCNATIDTNEQTFFPNLKAGTYTIQFSGRQQDFRIDRFILKKDIGLSVTEAASEETLASPNLSCGYEPDQKTNDQDDLPLLFNDATYVNNGCAATSKSANLKSVFLLVLIALYTLTTSRRLYAQQY